MLPPTGAPFPIWTSRWETKTRGGADLIVVRKFDVRELFIPVVFEAR